MRLLVLIATIISIPQFSEASTKPLGLLVYYTKDFSGKQKKEFEKFIEALHLKISYQGKSLPFLGLDHTKTKPITEKYNEQLCKKILKKTYIFSCFSDSVSQPGKDSEVTGNDSTFRTTDLFDKRPQPPSCRFHRDTKDVQYKGRSDFWAQEAVGADLVDEEKKSAKNLEEKETIVCDSNAQNHENRVKAIVDGNNSFNKSKTVNYCVTATEKVRFIDHLIATRKGTTLVNHSMVTVGEHRMFPEKNLFQRLFKTSTQDKMRNIIWVQSAGNAWKGEKKLGFNNRTNAEDNYFVIGSLSPHGLPSTFSQEGRGVLISAPSDNSITSCPKNEDGCIPFSGTSGAAPQVTHALKAALERLPSLTKPQLRKLLKRTAIPMPNTFEKPRKNGVGMLNSYKIWKVAERIHKSCGNKREECVDLLLENQNTYRFPKLIWDDEIKSSFPYCFGKPGKASCRKQKKSFKKLRKAAFLEPYNKKLWKVLACAQGQQGHHVSQAFYNNIGRNFHAQPLSPQEVGIKSVDMDFLKNIDYFGNTKKVINSLPLSRDGILEARQQGLKALPILQRAIKSKDRMHRVWAINGSTDYDRNIAMKIINQGLSDKDPRVRKNAKRAREKILEKKFPIGF